MSFRTSAVSFAERWKMNLRRKSLAIDTEIENAVRAADKDA